VRTLTGQRSWCEECVVTTSGGAGGRLTMGSSQKRLSREDVLQSSNGSVRLGTAGRLAGWGER
jgi:hypothetical protein